VNCICACSLVVVRMLNMDQIVSRLLVISYQDTVWTFWGCMVVEIDASAC
jgi:hypothetical protein